jgi:hypothetical protein
MQDGFCNRHRGRDERMTAVAQTDDKKNFDQEMTS